MTVNHILRILLIEDDADDAELLQDALRNSGIEFLTHVINDGSKVSEYIQSATWFPEVVVMDLNLPKVHGRELLKEFKSSPAFSSIPLIVLTTSSSSEDKRYALEHGAKDFVIKPNTFAGLSDVVARIIKIVGKTEQNAG